MCQRCIRYLSHEATKGIDFADKMALGRPADGTVAGEGGDGRAGCRDKSNADSNTGCGMRRFNTRMATPNDDYIPVTHNYILPTLAVRISQLQVPELIKCREMYIPRKFQMHTDADWLPDVIANPFATLVSNSGNEHSICHIPVAVIALGSERFAIGHVSRENPIWKDWQTDGNQTSMVFTGPNAYVSPLTYQDAIQVPTWNYIAVHLKGRPVTIHFDEGPDALHVIMDTLITQFEPEYLPVWRALDTVNQEKLLRGIVGFKMQIVDVECAEKLSQNRTQRDAEAIADVLDAAGQSALASRMLEVRK